MDLLFPPEGLRLLPDFLSEAEEQRLVETFETLPWEEVRMHGVAARRVVAHFGVKYAYESYGIGAASALPEPLVSLRDRCAALAEIPHGDLVETLVTRYPPGAGIGWHRDAPVFGPVVVGVSLVSDCTMRFRLVPARRPAPVLATATRSAKARPARETTRSLPVLLPARSVYVLAGPARCLWQHGLPAVKSLRYSVTFRTLLNVGGKVLP